VSVAAQCPLQQAGLQPRRAHLLDLLGAVGPGLSAKAMNQRLHELQRFGHRAAHGGRPGQAREPARRERPCGPAQRRCTRCL